MVLTILTPELWLRLRSNEGQNFERNHQETHKDAILKQVRDVSCVTAYEGKCICINKVLTYTTTLVSPSYKVGFLS
jgi:hypothetical protein